MDNDETLLRRARLRELITTCFAGRLSDLLAHIKTHSGKDANQGELSALQKDNGGKSFGDKKAKTLTEQIGLPRHWFAMPLGTDLERSKWNEHAALPPPVRLEASDNVRVWSSAPKQPTSRLEAAISTLRGLPPDLQNEAISFIEFTQTKATGSANAAAA